MAELTSLKHKRRTLKGQITRLNNVYEAESEKENPNLPNLTERLSKMEIVLDQFNEIQSEIEKFIDSDDEEAKTAEENERWNFEDSYFNTISAIRNFINKSLKPTNDNGSTTNTSGTSSPSIELNSTPWLKVKLPTMNLPEFDGNYASWLFFKDTFNSLVHADNRIPAIQKFHYLRLALKGEAANVISSLEVSAANYGVAHKLLLERYENTELLISNHVSALFNLPLINKENHSALRKLLDEVSKHLRALEVLKQPTDKWDTLIIHLVASKLDPISRRHWEDEKSREKHTKFSNLGDFLKQRCRLLETLHPPCNSVMDNKGKTRALVSTDNSKCPLCKQPHLAYNCPEFLRLSAKARFDRAKLLHLCVNCLRLGHNVNGCRSGGCRRCNKKHNSLLHFEEYPQVGRGVPEQTVSNVVSREEQSQPDYPNSTITHSYQLRANHVLLPTALITILDATGGKHTCRALLDSGSQSNFISAKLQQELNTPTTKIDMQVTGLNNLTTAIRQKTSVTFISRHTSYKTKVSCLITPNISNSSPRFSNKSKLAFPLPQNIQLADPDFDEFSEIDILLGSGVFWELLCSGQVDLGRGKPTLHKTLLGWIIAGNFHSNHAEQVTKNHFVTANPDLSAIDQNLRRFWELEEVPGSKPLSTTEQYCENHFSKNTRHELDGRFVVSIPLKEPVLLGDSLNTATKCLESLERRFKRVPHTREQYRQFMQEYESLGHMTRIEIPKFDKYYYIPHHCVIRDDSLTTKLRVVFNASSKTTNGQSLNDYQFTGPALQDDLFSILIRFRKHAYVLCADVEKMYLQILVDESQRDYQRILWRDDPSQSIVHYNLNTITYGTTSASFMAVRALQETARENIEKFPEASNIILNDFYMDDLMTGHDSREKLTQLRAQIKSILSQSCFPLRKWISNDPSILQDMKPTESHLDVLEICDKDPLKALGLLWLPESDNLAFRVKQVNQSQTVSKRTILSTIAQLFDPLGLIGPCIVIPKIIIQKLWLLKCDWDEAIPSALYTEWIKFRDELCLLLELKIPRRALAHEAKVVEIHGFCDASAVAYGACVYMRTIATNGTVFVRLLCSKARVAPAKTITIPRLELCGALLLSKLASKVTTALKIQLDSQTYWCDSRIVHAWIRTAPTSLKTFVANRTAEIQGLTSIESWRHVKSRDNPADLLFRGITPSDIKENLFWWTGPTWLSQPESVWPSSTLESTTYVPELKLTTRVLVTQTTDEALSQNLVLELLTKSVHYTFVQRTVAYCLRFSANCSRKNDVLQFGPLTTAELRLSESVITKSIQRHAFGQEIRDLEDSKAISNRSKLLPLNPFLDREGVLRVGGRIGKSKFSFDRRYPAIIPTYHPLSILLAKREHLRHLHAGPQSTLYALRARYWPLAGRNLAKKVIRECSVCFRFDSQPMKHIMGELPESRVTPTRPFFVCGVDYGGPYLIRDRSTRNYKSIKAYVCLFVCFSTKAVHLELVSDLTTEAFLASFRRFMARRGKCQKIYSDNATNFQGAQAELARFLQTSDVQLASKLAEEGVSWSFIPPRSPHFGGLWEAGIRSTKHHIKRVLGEAVLTFEQFYTLLVQIEACLNSRPLQPLSSDPNDPIALTPAHFLIGEPITAIPEPHLLETPDNRLSKFQRLQRMYQHFWKRWSQEYVSELQTRVKWRRNHPSLLKEGSLVLVREDNVPPLKWLLGRVVARHPGADGVSRVATIKTVNGHFKRPVVKLCVLSDREEDRL